MLNKRVAKLIGLLVFLMTFNSCDQISSTVGSGNGTPANVTSLSKTSIATLQVPNPIVTNTAQTPLLSSTNGIAFALLNDNRLLAVSAKDGTVIAEHQLTAAPPTKLYGAFPCHCLAMSRDNKTLYALVSGWSDHNDQLVLIDVKTTQVQATYPIANSSSKFAQMGNVNSVYHSLAVGPQSGRLYIFGNQAESLVVTVLDPNNGKQLVNWIAPKRPYENDEPLYQAAVSLDEKYLYVSYHNYSMQVLEVDSDKMTCCKVTESHLSSHGGFAVYKSGVLTGDGDGAINYIDVAGSSKREYRITIAGHAMHQMEFIVDIKTNKLYTVYSCTHSDGGVSEIDLQVEPALLKLIIPPKPANSDQVNGVCGEQVAIGPGFMLVTNKVSDKHTDDGLLFLNRDTGQVLHKVVMPALVVGVIFAILG